MPLCINPICPRPENPEDRSICEACGSHLLLQNRYRVMKVLHQREDRVTTLYDVVDEKDQDTPKVLKVLYTKNQDTISRFDREADLLKNYRIEGLPTVGQDGYFPIEFPDNPIPAHCLVMEKIPGLNLEQWLKQHGAIDERRAIDWLKQLTTVLERLHSNNFIHRDIKPSNIMYRNSDNRIFLIDLGAVRLINQNIDEQTTTTIGSFPYMAPEQYKGKADFKSDFYALGRTFVHLLTNKNPSQIEQDTQEKSLWRAESTPVSDQFATLIDSLLERKPDRRPKNTTDILKRIQVIEDKVNSQENSRSIFQKVVLGVMVLGVLVFGYFAIKSDPSPTNPNTSNDTQCRIRKDGKQDSNALARDAQKAINAAKAQDSPYPIIQEYSNIILDPKQFGCTVRVEILRKRDQIILPELAEELAQVIRESVNNSVKDAIKVDIVPSYLD
ncbi:MAG: serine/threonine protein kinase [Microcystis aeruginosa Ma_QC_Ca_00000000_S207]|uniref:non-specific serine/threonine protein kinase n=1 Tax=Microcystis aeruginosa Ma_QC_Ca_00000000_S207 TaxID=2486251 RepID=A0A552FGI6_MICAE|nr:MAG: serine/threonine protein kinase [Microcystis aeruginosa Ma_QC_Ca_00000000_S207]